MQTKTPIAIFCSDIHLSLNPPVWRSCEKSWFKAMTRPLNEIRDLSSKYDCPVICAGDVFDRWNSPPELINFAIMNLPIMTTVAGQHDLPFHNLKKIKKSAFYTLAKSQTIRPLYNGGFAEFDLFSTKLLVKGFSFAEPFSVPNINKNDNIISVGVIHKYIWTKTYGYIGASDEDNVEISLPEPLRKYDILVFGDNHIPFDIKLKNGPHIINCGSLMRRRSDEVNHKPRVYLLYEDKSIGIHYLDTSKDVHLEAVEEEKEIETSDVKDFIKSLTKLGKSGLDFESAIKEYVESKKISKEIKTIIYEAMESK